MYTFFLKFFPTHVVFPPFHRSNETSGGAEETGGASQPGAAETKTNRNEVCFFSREQPRPINLSFYTAFSVVCYKANLVIVIFECPFLAVFFDCCISALCRHEEERRRREEEMMRHREQEDLRRHTEGFKPNYMDNVSTETPVHHGVNMYCTLILFN